MRLIISTVKFEEFLVQIDKEDEPVDLIILGFYSFDRVNYSKELSGATSVFEGLVLLSKDFNCTVLAGVECDLFSQNYTSIIIAQKGKLLGAIDSIGSRYIPHYRELKLYEQGKLSFGILVDDDIKNFKYIEIFKKFEVDFLINISKENLQKEDAIGQQLKKHQLPLVILGKDVCLCYDKDKGYVSFKNLSYLTKEFLF